MDFSGIVKFQSIDDNGLYTWQKMEINLYAVKGLLEMKEMGPNQLTVNRLVPLKGIKYAKEWSFSSALSGFGFDVLWESGKVWSFLVENENDCLKWVQLLNDTINAKARALDNNNEVNEDTIFDRKTSILENHKEFLCESSHFDKSVKYEPSASLFSKTIPSNELGITFCASPKAMSSKILSTAGTSLERNFETAMPLEYKGSERKSDSNIYHVMDSNNLIRSKFIGQDIETDRNDFVMSKKCDDVEKFQQLVNNFDLSSSVRSTTTIKEEYLYPVTKHNTEESLNTTIALPSLKDGGFVVASNASNNVGLEKEISRKPLKESNASKQVNTTNPAVNSLDTIYTYQTLLRSLQSRCEENEIQLEQQRNSFEALNKELKEKLISTQHQLRTLGMENSQLQQQLQDISQNKQHQMKEELQRARSENYAFYESNIKSVDLQHQREMQCLQDELMQLRKSRSQETDQLQALNKQLEDKLRQSYSDTEFYKQKLQLIESQCLSMQQSKAQYEQQSLQRVQELMQQYETKQQAQHQFFQSQLLQSQNQYDDRLQQSVREAEEQCCREHQRDINLQREEMEQQFTYKIKILQQEHLQTLEQSKSQQLQLHVKELESIKATFLQREKQISEDLLLLEKLHSERIQSYEHQILDKSQAIQQLQDKFAQSLLHSDIKEQNSLSQYQNLDKKFAQLQLEYHEMYNGKLLLQQNYDVLQQQFSNLRQQAIDSITQAKLLQRENNDLHSSLNESRSSLSHYEKNLIPQSEDYQRQLLHQVRILQEENKMVENEMTRFKNELNHFQQQCKYLETLVYGIPQHDNNSSNCSTYKSDIPGSLCSYCSCRYYPSSHSAKEEINQTKAQTIERSPNDSFIHKVTQLKDSSQRRQKN